LILLKMSEEKEKKNKMLGCQIKRTTSGALRIPTRSSTG